MNDSLLKRRKETKFVRLLLRVQTETTSEKLQVGEMDFYFISYFSVAEKLG